MVGSIDELALYECVWELSHLCAKCFVFTGAVTPRNITAFFPPFSFSFGEIGKKKSFIKFLVSKVHFRIIFFPKNKTLTSFFKTGICSLSGMTLKIQCTQRQKLEQMILKTQTNKQSFQFSFCEAQLCVKAPHVVFGQSRVLSHMVSCAIAALMGFLLFITCW